MRQLKIVNSITSREDESLEKYLTEIKKEDLLTSEEEVDLAQKIREGDEQALEKLTKANLRFVVSVAKQYQNKGLSLSDLINEGNIGLIKAAGRFDETRGFKFISYAVWWIRQSILLALVETSTIIRRPLNMINLVNKVDNAYKGLEQRFQREPSISELLEELPEIRIEEIELVMKFSSKHASLDENFSDENENTLLDILSNYSDPMPDDKLVRKESLYEDLQRSLKILNSREQDVVKYYFGIDREYPMSFRQIAKTLNVTEVTARSILGKALIRLRNKRNTNFLKNHR